MTVGYYGYKAYEHWKDDSNKEQQYWNGEQSGYKMDAHKAKDGNQKDGTPKSNIDQNKQASAAKKEIEKKLGKKLTKSEEREFHDHVTGQNYDYHELVNEGYWLFSGK